MTERPEQEPTMPLPSTAEGEPTPQCKNCGLAKANHSPRYLKCPRIEGGYSDVLTFFPAPVVSSDEPKRPCVIGEASAAPRSAPRYEYRTTTGPRKSWDCEPDLTVEGWELDPDRGRPGESWERFDSHEEKYWRRAIQWEAGTARLAISTPASAPEHAAASGGVEPPELIDGELDDLISEHTWEARVAIRRHVASLRARLTEAEQDATRLRSTLASTQRDSVWAILEGSDYEGAWLRSVHASRVDAERALYQLLPRRARGGEFWLIQEYEIGGASLDAGAEIRTRKELAASRASSPASPRTE